MTRSADGHFTFNIKEEVDLTIIDRLAFRLLPRPGDEESEIPFDNHLINLGGDLTNYGRGWIALTMGSYQSLVGVTYEQAEFFFVGRYFFVKYDEKIEVIAPEQVSLVQKGKSMSLASITAQFPPISELRYRLMNNLDRVNRALRPQMEEAFKKWNYEANISLTDDQPMPVSKLFVTVDGTRLCLRPPYFAWQLDETSILFEDIVVTASTPRGFEPEIPFNATNDINLEGFTFFHEELLKGKLIDYKHVFGGLLFEETDGPEEVEHAEKEFEAYLLFFGYFGLKFYSESFRLASQPVVYDFLTAEEGEEV